MAVAKPRHPTAINARPILSARWTAVSGWPEIHMNPTAAPIPRKNSAIAISGP